MFYLWMSYWNALSVILAAVIVVASLKTSIARYRISLACFTIWSLGQVGVAIFPTLFGIGMANAFGPGRVSQLAYIRPLLTAAYFDIPVLGLLRVYSTSAALKWVLVLTGIAVGWSLLTFLLAAAKHHGQSFGLSDSGKAALFHLLLWMRIYQLRLATEAGEEHGDALHVSEGRRDIWL